MSISELQSQINKLQNQIHNWMIAIDQLLINKKQYEDEVRTLSDRPRQLRAAAETALDNGDRAEHDRCIDEIRAAKTAIEAARNKFAGLTGHAAELITQQDKFQEVLAPLVEEVDEIISTIRTKQIGVMGLRDMLGGSIQRLNEIRHSLPPEESAEQSPASKKK